MQKRDSCYKNLVNLMPPKEIIKIRSESDFYGISALLSEKLGLPFSPWSRAAWRHGWLFPKLKYIEQITAHQRTEENLFLVAKKEQEKFLKLKGINAKAVGMPFLYAQEFETKNISRIKNSLLIMPPHSLPTTSLQWDEETYVESIVEIKKDFDFIVVCLYQSCIDQNLWIKTFDKYDIPWISGASSDDKNALIRMRRLFKSFEYMTTNTIGSHILYASYCGCKVSIYGNYTEYSKDDYKNDTTYKRFPFLLDHDLFYASEKNVKEKYSFLFQQPKNANINLDWARSEIGEENKVSLYGLAIAFGWLPHIQILMIVKKIFRKIKKYYIEVG